MTKSGPSRVSSVPSPSSPASRRRASDPDPATTVRPDEEPPRPPATDSRPPSIPQVGSGPTGSIDVSFASEPAESTAPDTPASPSLEVPDSDTAQTTLESGRTSTQPDSGGSTLLSAPAPAERYEEDLEERVVKLEREQDRLVRRLEALEASAARKADVGPRSVDGRGPPTLWLALLVGGAVLSLILVALLGR